MKKILSLGVAAAVVSLTAVAASAAIAPAFDTDAPVAGETLTVQVVANGMTQEATTFTVNASEGLTLTANEAVTGGIFSTETNKFAWAGTAVPADGTVLLTLTYTVDAAADSEVSVSLTPDAGFTDISADAVAAVVVAGASTDVPNVTVETTETVESTEQPTVMFRILNNCGSSSILVFRMIFPTVVTRGSFRTVHARFSLFSDCTSMERNLYPLRCS